MTELKVAAPPRAPLRYQLDTGLAQLTPAERAAKGTDARAEVPREAHAMFDPGPTGRTRSPCWRSRRQRGCRSWSRSGTAG